MLFLVLPNFCLVPFLLGVLLYLRSVERQMLGYHFLWFDFQTHGFILFFKFPEIAWSLFFFNLISEFLPRIGEFNLFPFIRITSIFGFILATLFFYVLYFLISFPLWYLLRVNKCRFFFCPLWSGIQTSYLYMNIYIYFPTTYS